MEIIPKFLYFGLKTVFLCFQKHCITPKLHLNLCFKKSLNEQPHSQITIFGQRICSESTCNKNGILPECPDCSRNNGNTIQQIKGPAIKILRSNVFNTLPASDHIDLVPHFYISCYSSNIFIIEFLH